MRARSVLLSSLGVIGAGVMAWLLMRLLPPVVVGAPMAIGAASLLPAAVVLAAMTLAQMGARFVSGSFDPTAGSDGRFLVVNQRVITNTVEQMLCFVPSLLALSAALPPERVMIVAALGMTFAVARLVFWAGYLADPLWRAPGMAASVAVSLAALFYAVRIWLA